LVALPVIFSSMNPISKKKLNILFLLFIGAVTAGSIISFSILLSNTAKNFREISPFISHIRFSLNVALAIFVSIYFAITVFKEKPFLRILSIMVIIWLVAFLFMIESVIGISVLIIVSFVLLVYGILKQQRFFHKAALILTLIVVPLIVFMYLHDAVKSYRTPYKNDLTQLDEKIKTIDRQKNEQEAVLQSMAEGVIAINQNKQIITINKAAQKLLDLNSEKVEGMTIKEIVKYKQLRRIFLKP